MQYTTIKNTDLRIAPVNLGGNVFGWTLDESRSFDILDAFTAGGFNFIDTADTYPWWVNGTGGLSESIIGKWMKERGNRENMVIATKVGSETRNHPYDISRTHILRSVDESLQRLRTDYIDLYYTHFDDNTTPVAETLAAYDEVIRTGKVRYIAASNVSPGRLKESFALAAEQGLPKYVALQPHYNLIERSSFEQDYAGIAAAHGLGVFPYWSLASGFLTGKYRSAADLGKSPRGGGVEKYMTPGGMAVLDRLDTVAARHHTTPAAISLAWLLANPLVTAPIVSATSQSQLQTIFEAPQIKLGAEDLALLNAGE